MSAKFAFVVDGDVIGTVNIPQTAPHYDVWVAGMNSDPKVVPIPENTDVRGGWTYDGSEFQPPSEG